MAFGRSSGGGGEGGIRGGLGIRRGRNRRGRERRGCRSCIYGGVRGGCGMMKQLGRGVSRGVDLRGWLIFWRG